ncbi:hypothetical protein HK098_003829 [Nowakowskiella sp. JEL0407]|nr:hypothetical protein HK098_003829 [Nowakowskiella sp. JEL0407]
MVAAIPSIPGSGKPLKSQFNFSPSDDIALIKEVMNSTPFRADHGGKKKKWEEVAINFNLAINRKTDLMKYISCQRHFEKLEDTFRKQEIKSLRVSRTEEEYDKHERLLTGLLVDKHNMEKQLKMAKKAKLAEKKAAATAEIIEAILNCVIKKKMQAALNRVVKKKTLQRSRRNDEALLSLPPQTRKRKSPNQSKSIAVYFDSKPRLKEKSLELQERKLKLEKAKF